MDRLDGMHIGMHLTDRDISAMESRKQRHDLKVETFMSIAEVISRLSTCKFTKVGALIVSSDWRILSTGYNGTVGGESHCCDMDMSRDDHKVFADEEEIHAEMNCAIQLIGKACSLNGAMLFTTLSPCFNCLKHMRAIGIKIVYYREIYWRINEEELKRNAKKTGVSLYRA